MEGKNVYREFKKSGHQEMSLSISTIGVWRPQYWLVNFGTHGRHSLTRAPAGLLLLLLLVYCTAITTTTLTLTLTLTSDAIIVGMISY